LSNFFILMHNSKASSLIVTIKMQEQALAFFNEIRCKHYPAYCNYVDAHITLFHKLPSEVHSIQDLLEQTANRNQFELYISSVKQLNSSVSFVIDSPELLSIHKQLQKQFNSYLTTKDRKKIRPHITVQNKVTVYKAQQTALLLLKDFKPFTFQAVGFSTYLFNKNKWTHQKDYLFSST